MKQPSRLLHCIFLIIVALALHSCFLIQDRTTVVYGTITDENGQPVDSIMVILQGVKGFQYATLKEVFSASDGNYELVVDVPKSYEASNVLIPFGMDNAKFEKGYMGAKPTKNEKPTSNCCLTDIGQKTRYDFQLVAK